MADPNLSDFYGRLRRINKIRRRGGGFEAAGTLGRSHFNHPPRARIPWVGPLLIVLVAVFALKGVIHARIGADTYNARVAQLQAGGGLDAAGGFIMQADPLTIYISQKVRPYLRSVAG